MYIKHQHAQMPTREQKNVFHASGKTHTEHAKYFFPVCYSVFFAYDWYVILSFWPAGPVFFFAYMTE